MYCGCACALTVLQLRGVADLPTQDALFDLAGQMPLSVQTLSQAMNDLDGGRGVDEWIGAGVYPPDNQDPSTLPRVLSVGGLWIAHMREHMARLGHFVIVANVQNGVLEILDPWGEGTTYEMALDAFMRFWNLEVVYLTGPR